MAKMHRVFIDGQAGTTGLRLAERMAKRPDIELVEIEEELRKDIKERLSCIAEADVTFLCLPDDSALEIIAAIRAAAEKSGTDSPLSTCTIIDCSTAHRIAEGWAYGLPELIHGEEGSRAGKGKRISNPGCHATGFIMSVRPLVDAEILDPRAEMYCHSVTGYSGGGKPMIAEYEAHDDFCATSRKKDKRAPRQYALAQEHKHLPEMHKYSGLEKAPVFSPIVCDYYCGMLVSVPLPRGALRRGASAEAIQEALAVHYEGCPLVQVRPIGDEFSEAAGAGYLSVDAFAGRDDIEIFVTGKDDRIEIVSRYDNLGKGASGAAIQNMNRLLGLPETTGLILGA